MNLKERTLEIRKNLEQYQYGFKNTLSSNIDKEKLLLKLPAYSSLTEFDCIYYSIKGKELLKKEGIETEIYTGRDEFSIWESHCYLKSEKGEIIDFTPLYPIIGAKHPEGKEMSKGEIEIYLNVHSVKLTNMLPMHYNNSEKSLLRIGAKRLTYDGFVRHRTPFIEVYLDMVVKGESVVKGPVIIQKSARYIGINESFDSMLRNGMIELSHASKDDSLILDQASVIDSYIAKFLYKVL